MTALNLQSYSSTTSRYQVDPVEDRPGSTEILPANVLRLGTMELNSNLKRGRDSNEDGHGRINHPVDPPFLLSSSTTPPMDTIFVYDDETPVFLSVGSQEDVLKEQIVKHGGQVSDVLHAHFHVGRHGRSSILLRKVPLVHPVWVARSVKAKRMVPMYEYVEETQEHALGFLSPEQRDLAEMIKAMSQTSIRQVFKTLHQKLPHKTSNEWHSLYQESQPGIDEVVAVMKSQIASVVEEKANEIILGMFPSPASRTSPSSDVDMHDYSNDRRIKQEAASNDDTDDGYQSSEVVHKSLTGHRNRTVVRVKDKPKTTKRPIIRRVRVTPDDINAMVRFAKELGREPFLSDWHVFYNMGAENQKRTPAAWNTQYSMKRELIRDTIERLEAQ